MKIYSKIKKLLEAKKAAYFVLIDPDKSSGEKLERFVKHCESVGVDGFLIGGSLMVAGNLSATITTIKSNCSLPAIIFPGSVNQITPEADAILYLSLISGRNPEHLIGSHVISSPIIKRTGIEPISTGYMLIESGMQTTAEYISGSKPIPRNKPEIAAATALAGEYLGMKLIYLEGGSGAQYSVPNEMIRSVKDQLSIPLIVGGGIRDSKSAAEKVLAGADIIITGNYFEDEENWHLLKDFANAVHFPKSIEV